MDTNADEDALRTELHELVAKPKDPDCKKDEENGPLDVVQEAMGVLGPWHIAIAISISLVKFPVAWYQLSIVFLAPKADFLCVDPGFNETRNVCEANVNGTEVECSKFEYNTSIFQETIVTKWDLVCSRSPLSSHVQSVTMFGILIGNMLFGIIADRMGRKIPLIIAIGIQSVFGLASAFAPWYELFLLFKFISALATGGTMLIGFVLVMEIVGIEWRSFISVVYHLPFLLGQLMNPLISYLTKTWSGFQIAVSVPPMLLLSYYWILPESPRWLLAVGRMKEAEAVLTEAAIKNKIPLGNVSAAIEFHENQRNNKSERKDAKYNITHLFRSPNLCVKTICLCFNWFACGICFFGLSQYMGHIGGNLFLNVTIAGLMELPGTALVLFLISRVSRLKILMTSNLVAGVSLLLTTTCSGNTVQVMLAVMGLVGITVSFPTVYLYSGEAFPTVVRNVGIGMASVCARVGSMIAPYIADMAPSKPWLPPVLFGIAPMIAAGLCFFLPETMNCKLPETIEDGENFGKKKPVDNDA